MAKRWTSILQGKINTRLLVQRSDGFITIGHYNPKVGAWLDDSHDTIASADKPLYYCRDIPEAHTPEGIKPRVVKKRGGGLYA
jgi:hypothetical protein